MKKFVPYFAGLLLILVCILSFSKFIDSTSANHSSNLLFSLNYENNFKDSSASGNNASPSTGYTITNDPVRGNVATATNGSQFQNLPSAMPSGSFTYSSWVKFNQISAGYSPIFASHGINEDNYFLVMAIHSNATGKSLIGAFMKKNGIQIMVPLGPVIEANTWHLVTTTYDEPTQSFKIYHNGQLMSSTSTSQLGNWPGNSYMWIGSYFGLVGMSGSQDNACLFNRSLAASEVSELYGLDGNCVAVDTPIPVQPTNLTTASGSEFVRLDWQDSSELVSDYKIEYKKSSDTVWSVYNDGVETVSETVVRNLQNDLQYNFRVSSMNARGTSLASSEQTETPYLDGYDIVIVAGQSNAVGSALTALIGNMEPHKETWRIKQVGRFNGFNNQIIPAGDSLHNFVIGNSPSFGMSFARTYRERNLDDNREVLLVPAALSGSGFDAAVNNWNVGGTLSTDLIARSNLAYASHANNKFIAFLWHQGENEAYAINGGNTTINQQWYENKWITMMSDYDDQINGFDNTVPALVGQLSSTAVATSGGAKINAAHQNLVNLRQKTGFVSTITPTILVTWDPVHFSESSLAILAQRYYDKFIAL